MLHAKVQECRTFGSGKDFKEFLIEMGVAAILVMQPGPYNKLSLPFYMKLGFDWPSFFWRSLKMVDDGWTTDGRTDDAR